MAKDYFFGHVPCPITEGRITGTGTALSVSHWAEHMNWVFGTHSSDEFLDIARRMNLAEAASNTASATTANWRSGI